MSLKSNLVANYLGQGWTALMQLAFIPLYIKYLGMESYGLIGIFAMLQAWLILADLGMTMTLNREMARFTAGAHTPISIAELLRSMEVICFGIALLITLIVFAASGWFSQHWLHFDQLPNGTVKNAIRVMGVVAALRFVESIYRGAIQGLQAQVWLNTVSAILATIRGVGALAVLGWISPTINAFFVWQGFVSIITVVVLALRVHQFMPIVFEPIHFSMQSIRNVWVFARGMIVTTCLSMVLMQTDKILLSHLLTLKGFGEYMLVATVANSLNILIGPITQSYYPRLTEQLAKNDQHGLIASYHQSSQLMTVMIMPAALMLIFHGEAEFYLWTGDATLAKNSAPLLALLACGSSFRGLMNIPYMLQLAYGWSMFAAKVNAVIVAILIPILLISVPIYGAIAAGWVWVCVTSIYILVVIQIMHLRLLPEEKWSWYLYDTIFPLASAIFVSYLGTLFYTEESTKIWQAICLSLFGLLSFFAAFLSSKNLRSNIFNRAQSYVTQLQIHKKRNSHE